MMIVMKATATEEEIRRPSSTASRASARRAHLSAGDEITVIGAIGDREHDLRVADLGLEALPGRRPGRCRSSSPTSSPSAELRHGEPTVLEIGGRQGRRRALRPDRRPLHRRVARPDARDRPHRQGRRAPRCFRGGAYKPRTRPYAFQGLGQEGLQHARRGQGADRPADRHRAHGRPRPRAGARGGRRDPDRRPQHAELHAADRGRPRRPPGAASSAGCRPRSRSC